MPAQFTKHFVQDLTQDIKIRQCGTIVFNADNESNIISVDLYNGTEPYSGGGTVAGAVICPDGATVALDNGTLTGNVASVTLKADCFAIPGQIGVGVQVISGSIRTTVLKAIYNVELLSTDNMVDPDSRITASVTQLIGDIEAATAEIPASDMASLMSGIAPTFSASTNYAAGAYVYYNGTLYKFTSAHAAGSWTGTDATQVALGNDLGSQVSDLQSAFNEVAEEQTTNYDLVWINGAYLNAGTPETYNGWRYTDFVTIGDAKVIDFTTNSTSGAAIYNDWYDANKDYISPSFSTYGTHLTPPEGAKYFRLSCRTNETNTASYKKTVVIGLDDKLDNSSQTITDMQSNINSLLYVSPNLFDKSTITEGSYILKNGTISTGYNDSFVSEPIRIKGNTNYKIGKKNIRIRVQNADGDLLTALNEDNLPADGVFSYQTDAYVRISDSIANAKTLMFCKSADYPTAYVPYGNTLKVSVNDSEIRQSPLNGKKVAWYGDSLIQNNWKDIVSLAFSMNATNCGVGGTKISGDNAASMCQATRINGEYEAQTDPNTGTVTQPVAVPADAEIIIIGGGTNDWAQNVPLGNIAVQFDENDDVKDETDTFYQACHCMFRRFHEERPNAKIIVLGTPYANYADRFDNTYGIYNNLGLSSLDYGKALCDVARMWGYFALDYGEYMGINDSNVRTLLNPGSDGSLHPSIDASKQMFAECCIQRLLTIKYLY